MSALLKSAGSLLVVFAVLGCSQVHAAPTAQRAASNSTRVAAGAAAKAAKKQTHHHRHHTHVASSGRHGHSRSWLIPPPPAYMPNILPELYGRRTTQTVSAPVEEADAEIGEDGELKKPENPYKKYVHTPGGEAPQHVETRKGVTTWSRT